MRFKTIFFVVLAVVVGVFSGKFMLNQYDSNFNIDSAFHENDNLYYFIKQGEYDSIDDMRENMMPFEYYIYEDVGGKFITYLGITKSFDNLIKIQGYFNNAGVTTYRLDVNLDNPNFDLVLSQYDKLLSQTEDNQTIKGICSQVLAKYEELVTNVDSN